MPENLKLFFIVESMRKHLQYLIDKKENLLDPEVISVSKKLDKALNRYYYAVQSRN